MNLPSPRHVLMLLVAGSLCVPAIGAHAAPAKKKKPKPVCKIVTDSPGDADGNGTPAGMPSSDANLDIVSADIATNATTLTGVVRVAKLAKSDSSAPTGWKYQVTFAAGGTTAEVNVVTGPAGTTWYGGKGKGVLDLAKNEVRISVPLSAVTVPIKPGTVISSIGARTYRAGFNDQIALGLVDTADSSRTYTSGTRSCVKVGA